MHGYFFNVKDGKNLSNHEGTVFADAEAARAVAVVTAGQMIQAHALRFWADADWRMQVTDAQGATVSDLRFSSTMGAWASFQRAATPGAGPLEGG